jgi:hypothetical protein
MTQAADRARIRRASQQARNAMRELDLRLIDELQELYSSTQEQIKARIAQAVDANNLVPVAHPKDLLRQVDDALDALGQQRNAILAQGLEQAAALGVRPYTLEGVAAVGATAPAAVLESSAAMRISTEAVRQVLAFEAADGLTLSDRVWRLDRGAKEALGRAIGQAVVSGWDASRAATALMMSGQPVPLDVQARMNAGKLPALLRGADLLTADSGPLWQAERVFRTEINRAHGNAYMASAEQTPGFVGFRFLLSSRHSVPDICDLLASQNLYGLGKGVYPDAKRCPWPAHPNTLSFVEMVFADEVTQADREGKETAAQALGRLSADVREGVLGKTKAEYFDKGLLGSGSIRSPLRSVETRLQRQERATTAPRAAPALHPDAIPNARDASVRADKLVKYALNMDSEAGRHKARVFDAVLGYNQSNFEELQQKLVQGVGTVAAVKNLQDAHGQRYTALIPVTGPKGSAVVTTGWIVRPASTAPDLTTAYIDPRRNKNV